MADPWDNCRLCITGPRGYLAVVDLDLDPIGSDRVQIRKYKLASSSSSSAAAGGGDHAASSRSRAPSGAVAANAPPLYARFGATRDVLFVLMQRELVVLDLELGVPFSSQVRGKGSQGASADKYAVR